jgi:hypothetical protein
MAKNIRMEWRQGATGLGNVYVFNPKPSITRANPQQYQVEYFLPLADGVTVQNLGKNKRTILLKGILVAKQYNVESTFILVGEKLNPKNIVGSLKNIGLKNLIFGGDYTKIILYEYLYQYKRHIF